jgi:hypothetical protein
VKKEHLIACAILVTAFLTLASQAGAGSTAVRVRMTFAEPIQPGIVQGCPISPQDGLCGSGEVIPFGHATETVIFGAGCGGSCDQRTINLPGGSITTDEFFSDFACPAGKCDHPGRGFPASGNVDDVVVSGTGAFFGASGGYSGSVHAAGTAGVADLSGTLTLQN